MIERSVLMYRTLWRLSVVAMFVILVETPSASEVVLQPTELIPGDQYRLFFTTSKKRDAMSSDVADYDQFVQDAIAASPLADLGLRWQAVISTVSIDARDHTNTNLEVGLGVPIYRVDGAIISHSNAGFWPFGDLLPLSDSYAVNEFGKLIEPPADPREDFVVWTGSTRFGTAMDGSNPGGFGCDGCWSNTYGVPTAGLVGIRMMWDVQRVEELGHFYGISEVITVAPEPDGFHGAVAFLCIVVCRGRHRR